MELNFSSGTPQVIFIILIGIALIGLGGRGLMEQNSAIQNAEAINVTIQSTGVETIDKKKGVAYKPEATFAYTYKGEGYTSEKVYPGPLSPDFHSEEAAAAVVESQEGETVRAYVDSNSPGEAFLKKEKTGTPFIFMFLGSIFAGFGAYLTLKP